MTLDSKIVWTEGMFLRVQHFQQTDRYVERLVRGRVDGLRPAPWGIRELVINRDLLGTGKFAVLRCRGTMEDGTPFAIPENDEAPPPLELPEGTRNCIVYLALPARQPGGVEFDTGESAGNLVARYRTTEIDTVDSVSASASVSRVRVGKLNLRFMLETQERNGYHCLGLARIVEVRADRNTLLDERYITPCLDSAAAPALAGFLSETLGLIRHRSEALAARVTGSGTKGVAEIADFLMLQLLNRTEPLLAHFARMADIHPETVYRTLVSLAGELTTFTGATKRPPEFPVYRHDDLQRTFEPVMIELRQSLSAVLEQSAVPIPLQERKYGIRVGQIADRSLLKASVFTLAVKADMPAEAVRRNFPSLVKIGPVEQIRELVNVALPGIRVRPLPVAPRQIPYHAGSTYFELERASPIWAQLENSGGIAIHVAGDFPGLAMELWAIKG